MKIFIEIILPILADIFLVFIVAFFAASETAFSVDDPAKFPLTPLISATAAAIR